MMLMTLAKKSLDGKITSEKKGATKKKKNPVHCVSIHPQFRLTPRFIIYLCQSLPKLSLLTQIIFLDCKHLINSNSLIYTLTLVPAMPRVFSQQQ